MEAEAMVLLKESSINFYRVSNEIKWKVKVVLIEVTLMMFFLWLCKEFNWKGKVVLLEVSLMNFILSDIQRDQMEGESGVTRSIIAELHSSDIE